MTNQQNEAKCCELSQVEMKWYWITVFTDNLRDRWESVTVSNGIASKDIGEI